MATMSNGDLWVLTHNVAGPGTVTDILATENKFVDKNISVKVVTPAAAGPTLTLTDKGNSNITVSSVTAINSQNYYILSTSLSGQLSVSTPGWLSVGGLGAADDVQVGRIQQSNLSTSSVIPQVSTSQTIYITPGYYSTTRTIAVSGMDVGTAAAATVSGSIAATTPILGNTNTTISGMTQVALSTTSTALTSSAGKYFVAMTTTAPATTVTPTVNITQSGYLGATSQINASASVTAKGQIFYSVLPTGAITVSSSKTAVAPTIANRAVSSATAIYIQATTTTTQPTDGYFYSLRLTAPATTLDNIVSVTTPGYIGNSSEVSVTAQTTAQTADYYIPISSGHLEAGAGVVSAVANNMSFTESSTRPSSGPYFVVTGYGSANVATTGYIISGVSTNSTTATKYYALPTPTYTFSGNQIVVNQSGWATNETVVGSIAAGSLTNSPKSGVNANDYQNLTSPILDVDDGYLYINAGYFENSKINIGTLLPDPTSAINATSNQMLAGFEAFDPDGNVLLGTIETYQGIYTVSTS